MYSNRASLSQAYANKLNSDLEKLLKESNLHCPSCFKNGSNIGTILKISRCSHVLCEDCLNKLIKLNCPLCRKVIKKEDFIKLSNLSDRVEILKEKAGKLLLNPSPPESLDGALANNYEQEMLKNIMQQTGKEEKEARVLVQQTLKNQEDNYLLSVDRRVTIANSILENMRQSQERVTRSTHSARYES